VSGQNAKARPKRAQHERQLSKQDLLEEAIQREIGDLHKTHMLLTAVQFAANHDCEFDVSDALAVIRDRVEQAITGLDEAVTAS
jgi:hypothetical protein